MNWFVDTLKNRYATFTGRAHRTEFWMFFLIALIIGVVLAVLDRIIGKDILSALFSLATLVPWLALGARRLHDTNRSGWWQLIGLVPVIGLIVLIVFFVADSEPGDNRFGPNPKQA